jgi:four helix bundle protein
MNDLHIRLKKFAVDSYKLSQKLRNDPLLDDNVNQLIRSASSPGANYGEAQSATSRRDFNYKIRCCLKEMRESNYWLCFFHELFPEINDLIPMIRESEELCKILYSIASKTQNP